MAAKQIIKKIVISTSALITVQCFAEVEFADEDIKADFEMIYAEYQEVRDFYTELDSSVLNYIIRYGNLQKCVQAVFETDGNVFYLTFRKKGIFSLQTLFVHEATHALQFEQGRFGFVQNSKGTWSSTNYDLKDELEAFISMLSVATNSDMLGLMEYNQAVVLIEIKRDVKSGNYQKLFTCLERIYPSLSHEDKNNPTVDPETMNKFYQSKGYKFCYIPFKPIWITSN